MQISIAKNIVKSRENKKFIKVFQQTTLVYKHILFVEGIIDGKVEGIYYNIYFICRLDLFDYEKTIYF